MEKYGDVIVIDNNLHKFSRKTSVLCYIEAEHLQHLVLPNNSEAELNMRVLSYIVSVFVSTSVYLSVCFMVCQD